MPQRFHVHFTDPSTAQKVEVVGEFSDAEWEILLRFAEYAEQLGQTRMVQEGSNVRCSIRLEAKKGINSSVIVPPENDIAAFLHRMRPFVLQDEPTSFFRVFSMMVDKAAAVFEIARMCEPLKGVVEHRSPCAPDGSL